MTDQAQTQRGDEDLISLYSKRILALAADIPHTDAVPEPQARVMKRSPLCGSTVTVELSMEDGKVSAFGQNVKACALGQASAAVLGSQVIGRGRDEIEKARDQLQAMLKQDGPVPDAPFDGYEALLPAKDFKNRHASIMLSLNATLAAMDEILAKEQAKA